jgi:hypothetical protein
VSPGAFLAYAPDRHGQRTRPFASWTSRKRSAENERFHRASTGRRAILSRWALARRWASFERWTGLRGRPLEDGHPKRPRGRVSTRVHRASRERYCPCLGP